MAFLHALDEVDDIWVASATASRDLAGTETMVGTFARQVLLRFAWPREGEPLAGVHAMLTETQDQPPVPHGLVRDMLEERHPDAPFAYRYVFNHRLVGASPGEDETPEDVPYRPGPKHAAANREEDILFMVMQSGEQRLLHWYLRSDRFASADIELLLTAFHEALLQLLEEG